LELIDKYGADAVRFGILISSPAGNDLLFDEASLEQGRNFNNKLWNALKLVRSWESRVQSSELEADSFAGDWFENRLNEAKAQIDELLKDFKLSEALKILYSLIWDDFCSWYLEWAKPEFEKPISKNIYEKSVYFFEELLQLLHPFMPFITEEIYHLLKDQNDDLCIRQFDQISKCKKNILGEGLFLKDMITDIRNTKSKLGTSSFTAYITSNQYKRLFPIIEKTTKIKVRHTSKAIDNAISLHVHGETIFIEPEETIDINLHKEQLLKDLEYQKGFLQSVEKKLSNKRFVQNAKPEIIALEQKKKADAEVKIKVLEESLANL
jgi:valyl-tRNA synthetase